MYQISYRLGYFAAEFPRSDCPIKLSVKLKDCEAMPSDYVGQAEFGMTAG
jgi:hypothetical protein